MGFDIFGNTARLAFSGTRYDGMEIVVRTDVTLEAWESFAAADKLRDEWEWLAANALVSWNLERKGEPLPLDTPFPQLPVGMVRAVVRKWTQLALGIDAPLEDASPNGDSSVEQSTTTGTS